MNVLFSVPVFVGIGLLFSKVPLLGSLWCILLPLIALTDLEIEIAGGWLRQV